MKLDRTLVIGISLLLSALPRWAAAQANAPGQNSPTAVTGPSDGGPPAPPALDESVRPTAPPPQAAPAQQPPPAELQTQGSAPMQATPPGQWVYTQQYGWLWMPYGDSFTSVPQGDQGEPYMYVYGPSLGWSWVVAPWVWGWGPYPYYGVYGPARYAWYGWGPHWHGYYGGYYGWHGGYRGGVPYAGWHYGAVRPAPPRAGFGAVGHVGGGAHVGRPAGGGRGGHR